MRAAWQTGGSDGYPAKAARAVLWDDCVPGFPYAWCLRCLWTCHPHKLHRLQPRPSRVEALPCAVFSQPAEMLAYADNSEALDSAEAVVVAVCRGRGMYAYQSFLRQLEVTEVLRGDGIEPGDVIDTYDNLAIEEPYNYSGKGQFSSERRVRPAGLGPSMRGAAPLREGQAYLVFLNKKRGLPEASEPRYVQVHSAYAHVALDVSEHPERIRIGGAAPGEDDESIPFDEASAFDAFVSDEVARGAYLDGCRQAMASVGLRR